MTTALRRLLDGERTWGSLEISDSRYGMCRYRLTVYPPGLGRDERIPLRLWRAFPLWGLALWLTLQVALMPLTSPGVALAVSTGVYAVAALTVLGMAGRARGGVRTLTVVRMVGVHDADILARHLEFRVLAERLVRADALRAAGEMTAVEHEAEVWRVYDHLGALHSTS
jgi:hypothetical protein